MLVRDATPDDAAACAAIYAPYVLESVATFEQDPPTAQQMAERIAAAQASHAWLVAELDGDVVGYAYGVAFHTRPAYRWSSEVSVYLDGRVVGRGIGRALYEALIERLTARGLRMLVARIATPNPASEALHRALGFEPAAALRDIGWKLGAWRDVTFWQLALGSPGEPPADL